MKVLLLLFIASIISLGGSAQSIYSISFTNIDGGTVSMSSFQGFKTMIILAPLSSADSNRLKELKQFHMRYGDSVKIIGVMSNEDGFASSNALAIKNLYDSSGINIPIILTSGMNTKKASNNQSQLMKWLTEKDDNHRFDIDVKGIGDKFFINKNGKFYGKSGPSDLLNGGVVGWLVVRNS